MKRSLVIIISLFCSTVMYGQDLMEPLKDFSFLIGEYEIKTYMPRQDGGWAPLGTGESTVSTLLDGRFIVDQKATKFGSNSLTTNTTIGVDPRTGEVRFMALDKEWGTMDVYKGKKEGESLVVNNLKSDARFTDQQGNSLAFQLAYHYVSDDRIDFIVHASKDDGKSWQPYAKAEYSRK